MNKNYKFVTKQLEDEIENIVIPLIFPKLNKSDKKLLTKYTTRLINIISIIFNFDNDRDSYLFQLKQNNYQDIKWLITHLLPFLNNKKNQLDDLISLSDIYIHKEKDVDINLSEPVYLYSNIQYGRCDRNINGYIERRFSEEDIKQNFFILLDSLKIMSNKLHVNWIDVLPVPLEDYETNNLFKKIKKRFETNTVTDWDPVLDASFSIGEDVMYKTLSDKIMGLDLYDIYNVMSYDLFEDIKQIKWLIYDIPLKQIYPVIFLLSVFFGIERNLKQIEWDEFDNKKFNLMWNKLVEASELGSNVTYSMFNFKAEPLRKFMKGIIYSFDKSMWSITRKQAEKEGYIPISQNLTPIDEDFENDDDDDITFSMVLPSLKSMGAKLFYNFLTESLQKFKGTWYGTKMLNDKKTNIKESKFQPYVKTENLPITYKNIYNFSKSMVHHIVISTEPNGKTKKIFTRYPENWKSLNLAQKNDILARLNNKYKRWFTILRYIRNLYALYPTIVELYEPEIINEMIHEKLMENLPNIIFETMICKGILTEFIPNRLKSNLSNISRDKIYTLQKNIFDTTNDNKYWTSAYNYLTKIPYKFMDEFVINDKGSLNRHNHFTYNQNPDGGQWYSIYAYDWIAQIGFCHHFLNNRVIFITGATGVGKSTEVPKLFLYFTKSLEYIADPHIVCTEPRIAPTKKNAGYVADCLGVPLVSYVNGIETRTTNYYIQTQYKEKETTSTEEVTKNNTSGPHMKTVSHATLKYITDGTLILEASNVILKDKFIINKTIDGKIEETYKFSNNNLYDIIMVDEAHEHKINMDLLLTMLKFGATYNNNVKLVIISATMDNDEPKYRRYFRDINDNRKFPLCTWIRDNKLDRINVDRRYHISPPDMGTRYKVTKIFTPGVSEIDTIMDIVSKSDSGHILVFEPGVKEIIKLVEELNKVLPSNIIAIPYHSKIDDDKKSFIGEINNKLKFYKKDRSIIFSDPSIKMNEIHLGINTYTRAIIVATNIAEASITIINLKFVVDTGTQKIEPYDYKKRGTISKKIFIAEENHLQRAGRVGRKEAGTAIFLYDKKSLEDNTIDYEMSTKNIAVEIFKKLKNKDNEKKLILEDLDPNNPMLILSSEKIKEKYNEFGISLMILKQYFLDGQYYDYYGNDTMYDYKNYRRLHPFYETGLGYETITDNRGTFYLIHPNEVDFIRNIVGDITNKKKHNKEITFKKDRTNSGYIISKKIKSFWQILLDNLYISFNETNTSIIKTTLGIEIMKIFETLQTDEAYYGLIRAVIFGIAIGCGDDMLKLCAFYMAIQMSPLNVSKERLFNYDKEAHSDSQIILNYIRDFDNLLKSNGLNTNITSNGMTLYSKIPEVKKYNLSRDDLICLLGPEDEHTKELIKKISSEEKKGKIISSIENFIISEFFKSIHNNSDQIQIWCDVNNLDNMIFMKYLYEYCKLRSTLSRKMIKQTQNFIIDLKKSFKKTNIIEDRQLNLIDVALLFGYPCNICKKVDESMYYLSLYSPSLNNIYKIKSTSQYKYKPNTLANLLHLQNYVLYFTININPETDEDTMACLHKVDPKLITIMAHVYNKNTFSKYTSNINIMKKIREVIDSNEIDKNSELGKMIINYTKTLNQIESDLSIYSTRDAITVITNIDKLNEKIFETM